MAIEQRLAERKAQNRCMNCGVEGSRFNPVREREQVEIPGTTVPAYTVLAAFNGQKLDVLCDGCAEMFERHHL